MNKQRGYMILEALIAIVIFGMLVVAILPSLNFLVARSRQTKEDIQAALYLQEGMEATYNILTQTPAIADLSMFVPGQYKLVTGPQWSLQLTTVPEAIDIYERTIELSDICRDGNGEQVDCAIGTVDKMSKRVTVSVSWTISKPPIKAEMVVVKI